MPPELRYLGAAWQARFLVHRSRRWSGARGERDPGEPAAGDSGGAPLGGPDLAGRGGAQLGGGGAEVGGGERGVEGGGVGVGGGGRFPDDERVRGSSPETGSSAAAFATMQAQECFFVRH